MMRKSQNVYRTYRTKHLRRLNHAYIARPYPGRGFV